MTAPLPKPRPTPEPLPQPPMPGPMNPDETPIEIIELPPSQPTRGIPIDDPLPS